MRPDAVLATDHLRVPRTGSSPEERVVPVRAVRDADPDATPPEVRTVEGETVFFPAGQRAELRAFCARHGIALLRRADVWGDLLEPFLDTVFTAEHWAGLEPGEVPAVRDRVAPDARAAFRAWATGIADLASNP
ncbi:hypothetical protein ACWCYY_12250 [Kitasatospora sp. NPDC001664]